MLDLDVVTWAVWAGSAALFLWMLWDFLSVNRRFDEDVLLSSREGVDELFGDASQTTSTTKGN
jgi:hypothetical protein